MYYAAGKAKNYVNISRSGILINTSTNIKLNKKQMPKVSIIIPVYNCEKYILRTLRSIQNQNMSNFEIMLVNDFSNDNTSNIINNIKKGDNRIKIINNNQNRGILYSRCIGVIASKGEYIFPLDNDDMLLDKDVLYIVYKVAEKYDFDIVKFNGIGVKDIDNFFLNNLFFFINRETA